MIGQPPIISNELINSHLSNTNYDYIVQFEKYLVIDTSNIYINVQTNGNAHDKGCESVSV